MFALVALWLAQAAVSETLVARCEVRGDAQERIYELRRAGAADPIWTVVMRSRETGTSPVRLPLPGAAPDTGAGRLTLDYQTQNGGRDLEWRISPEAAVLDVHANFELEVNIEPDLDPRVELMNTGGPLTALSCTLPGGL